MTPNALARRQRGLSLIGLLIFGVIVVMLVVVGMRVLPTALEFFAIKRAVNQVASSGATTALEMQKAFDRIAAVDDIASITGKDLRIIRDGNQVLVSFQYEKRVPLYGPASLLLDYQGSASSGGASR